VAAFERLYHAYAAKVHTLAGRILGPALADETTREVFTRAWRSLGSLRGDSGFGDWISRLALDVVLAKWPAIGAGRSELGGGSADAISGRGGGETELDCETAVGRLPDGARVALVLHDIEGHSHEQISTLLGIDVDTSRSRVHRARLILAEFLLGWQR
jgi:RNA polymerase sigma-70 factor (ECF subfamily)